MAATERPAATALRLGVVSDTHGLLRPELVAGLAGVDHILHAGDVGDEGILEALRRVAPVTAIRGNVDIDDWADAYPEVRRVELAGRRILVLHDIAELRGDPAADGVAMVVFGHSHRPSIEWTGRLLRLNPGSAGPRRFRLPVSFATVEFGADGSLLPRIHPLGAGDDLR
jgi:uncharacterized protein